MDAPTVTDIKLWSKVDFAGLDEPFSDDELGVVVTRSIDYVTNATGRPLEGMPGVLISTAQQAIQMRAEQLAYQEQSDYVETGSDDQIQSFSAGGYSESRHAGGTRLSRGGSVAGYPLVNPWPALNNLLWMLMTEDAKDTWREILSGINAPAFGVTEVAWDGNPYSGNMANLDPGYGGHGSLPVDPFPPPTN